MGAVLQVDGQIRQILADEILTDDDDDHTGRTDVLLNACVDHTVIGDVAGLGEEHGGLVGNKDMTLGVGKLLPGHTVDGLILADIDVVGILGNVEIGAIGNVGVVLILAGGGDDDFADLLCLSDGLLGPCAGLNVNGLAVLHEVHGDHGELEGGAALDEQDLVVVGNAHQVAQILLGFVNDLLKDLGAVGHFHDAHAAAAVVEHFVTDLLQNRLRHHGGTCGEVVSAIVLHFGFLLLYFEISKLRNCAILTISSIVQF